MVTSLRRRSPPPPLFCQRLAPCYTALTRADPRKPGSHNYYLCQVIAHGRLLGRHLHLRARLRPRRTALLGCLTRFVIASALLLLLTWRVEGKPLTTKRWGMVSER